MSHIIHVPNIQDRTAVFAVESDVNFISGPSTVTIGSVWLLYILVTISIINQQLNVVTTNCFYFQCTCIFYCQVYSAILITLTTCITAGGNDIIDYPLTVFPKQSGTFSGALVFIAKAYSKPQRLVMLCHVHVCVQSCYVCYSRQHFHKQC